MDPSKITQNIERRVLSEARLAATRVAQDGQRKMAQAAPIKTGLLRSRITGAASKTPNGVKVTWTADTPYAAVQDRGFQSRAGKIVRFNNHPGGGGAGYMSDTFRNNLREWQQYVAQQIGSRLR